MAIMFLIGHLLVIAMIAISFSPLEKSLLA
jgi:hypothetical protein